MLGSMPNVPYAQGDPIYYPMQPQFQQQMPPQFQQQMQPQMQPQTQPRYVVPPTAPQLPAVAANHLKPKVRAQAPDPVPPPPRIVLPSPEALGIQVAAAAPSNAVDWNRIHARMEQVGVVNLRRERTQLGGFRVVLALPRQEVEGTGETEAAAMLTALARAEAVTLRH